MRGPKPNYTKDGVARSNYGPKPGGETSGTPTAPEPIPDPCTGLPVFGGYQANTHIQPDETILFTPAVFFTAPGGWNPGRVPTYFRFVIDPGGGLEQTSPNLAWDEVWAMPNGCLYAAPAPGAPFPLQLWAGNGCGEDFAVVNVTLFDIDTVCAP